MNTQDHVLVVDDDAELRQLLGTYLRRQGYRVSAAADGRALRAALSVSRPDLIVLDVMLPGEDGISLCRTLRAQSSIPIIMLTARAEETDRIVGLEIGADDYLPKPFNPRELLARIRSVLRRARALPENLAPDDARRLRFAGWQLDTVSRQLMAPDGVVVPLSGAEYRLLRVFLAHPATVLNRDQLMTLALGRDNDQPFDRSVDVQVSRLRRRLRDEGGERLIRTVRGEGYVLAAEVEAER